MTVRNKLNLASTRITDKIRVSTGLVRSSSELGGPFTYFESWIFSDDPRIKSNQIIHMTLHGDALEKDIPERAYLGALRWHCKVAKALSYKFNTHDRTARLAALVGPLVEDLQKCRDELDTTYRDRVEGVIPEKVILEITEYYDKTLATARAALKERGDDE